MKRFLSGVGLTLVLLTSLAATAFAQETQAPSPQGNPEKAQKHRRMGGPHGPRMGRRAHGLKGLRQLDLSDAQRQQIRSIHESVRKRTEAQRNELRQLLGAKRQGGAMTAEQEARARQLRDELRQTGEAVHGEVLAVLTAEQRTRLEQLREEHKERRGEFRNRRGQTRDDDQQ
ncbi:MAG: Spy/CpxP family protein refolding chaperone [Acidobacteria bacterium]|nr:Spy/CpxP family protein refolding chaperone [Acidobacteriota bacterium]